MGDAAMSPAQQAIEAHLGSVRFAAGVEEGRWIFQHLAWPYLFVRVIGKDPNSDATFAHDFRMHCEGFPDPGPNVERWVFADVPPHGHLPPPPSSGSPGFTDAMKWDEGMYRAWSRNAAPHGDWAQKRPDEAWNRHRHLVFIMEHLYALVSEQAVWLANHR